MELRTTLRGALPAVFGSESASGPAVGVPVAVAGIVAYLVLPGYGGVAAGLVAFGLLTALFPFLSLLLILGSLPFHFVVRRSPLGISIVDLLLISAWLGLLLQFGWGALTRGPAHMRAVARRAADTGYLWPGLILVLLATGSLLLMTPHAPPSGGESALRIGLRAYSELVEPLALFALVLMTVSSRRRVWILTDVLFAAAVLVSVIGIVRGVNLFLHPPSPHTVSFRTESLFNHPNTLALYISRSLPFFAGLVVALPKRTGRRWVYGAGVAAMAVVDLMSGSRGGWLAVAVALLMIGILSGRLRWTLPLAAVGTIGAVVLVGMRDRRHLASLIGVGSGSANTRLRLWHAALDEIRAHPLTGAGLGNVKWMHRYIPSQRLEGTQLVDSHNLVLDFWTKLGIFGLAAICWLVGAFYVRAWGLFRSADGTTRAFGLALLVAMTASVTHGLVDAFYFGIQLAVYFWLFLGLTDALARQPADEAARG